MLKNKLRKAYISIEIVVIAAVVLIGGLSGLSAFLKNGQGAQSQSAEAMNNIIDMIGEEFDFNVGSGEVPGGGEFPGGGNMSGGLENPDEMNEYGFYFNHKYSMEFYDEGESFVLDYVFRENGSCEIYLGDELLDRATAGYITYANHQLYFPDSPNPLLVTNNGTILLDETDGTTLTLIWGYIPLPTLSCPNDTYCIYGETPWTIDNELNITGDTDASNAESAEIQANTGLNAFGQILAMMIFSSEPSTENNDYLQCTGSYKYLYYGDKLVGYYSNNCLKADEAVLRYDTFQEKGEPTIETNFSYEILD